MLKHSCLVLLLISSLCASAACSRTKSPERTGGGDSASTQANGNDAAIPTIRAAAHAMTRPNPTLDYVAAEMEGVIMARTKSQALIHYDGYRATLTTASDRVTQIAFQLTEAKPSVKQLTEVFGKPREVRKGMLYEDDSDVTGAKILILAEPVSTPAEEGTLVRRIVLEGAATR